MADDLEKRITAKVVLDDTGFNSTLRGVNEELKETKSEFKLASEGLKTYGKTTEQLKQAQQALSKQMDLQKEKVEMYRQSMEKAREKMQQNILARDKLKESLEQCKEAYSKIISTQSKVLESYRKNESEINKLNNSYEKAKKSYGENSEECNKLKEQIEKLEQEQQKLISSNRKEIESYQKVQTELSETTEAYNKKASAVETNARAEQNYQRHLNDSNAEMTRTQGQLGNINRDIENNSNKWLQSSKILGEHSKKLKDTGEKVSDVGDSFLMLNVPLALAGGYALKTGMDFEYGMSGVQATAGATKEELGKLTDVAVDLGAKTKYNATQVSEGMQDLASAGFSVNEIVEAMPGNLDLAASSGENLATSSEIAASTLRGFGLQASYAGHVADVLAKNAAATNASVASTGMAMKYIAPVAHSMGLHLEEVTAAIGLMSNAGIKGTQAGTTLRGALVNLANPSKKMAKAMRQVGFEAFDAQGKMLPLNQIIGNLKKSTQNLTDKQKEQIISTIFGKEALSGMLALIDAGPDKLNSLTNSLKNSDGAAKQMADTMQDNAKTSVEQMMGSVESAAIKLEKNLAPSIKSVADTIGSLADKFGNLDPSIQKMIAGTVAGGLAFGGLAKILGGTAKGIGNVMDLAGRISGKIGTAKKATELATVATEGVTTAIEGAGAATTLAEGATVGLGGALSTIAVPVAIGVAAIAAVGYAGYKTYKYLHESATPAVDLFANKAVYSSTKVATAYGVMTTKVQTGTIKISNSTKKAVGAYMQLDKKASTSLMDLRMNSDKFTKEAKTVVLKNFTEMSKKSSNLSKEQREHMTVDFKKLVSDTGVLTKKNKDQVVKQYAAMVNGTKGLTKKQKEQTIKDFSDTLNKSVGITKNQTTSIEKIYADMGNQIKARLDKDKADDLKTLGDFLSKSNALTADAETTMLKKTAEHWDTKKKTIDDCEKQINDIIKKACDEHRQLTDKEAKTIHDIQQKMKENAVKTLSENEVESQVILERMKEHDGHITAEEASDHIKKLNDIRDKSIKAATEECDKRTAEIIRLSQDSQVISADQKKALIKDAEDQRDKTINAAKETRDKAVDHITKMDSSISQDVDTTSGNILTKWDKLKSWWDNWNPGVKSFVVDVAKSISPGLGNLLGANWSGTTNFKGGLTTLNERGDEIVELEQGSKVYTNYQSEEMIRQTAKNMADKFLQAAGKGINVEQNFYNAPSDPSELARQTRNSLMQLSLDY